MLTKKQLTQQKIITAAMTVLEQAPNQKLTVVAVTAQAGISRRTFYRYYTSIDALIAALEHQLWNDTLQLFVPLFSASKWADTAFVAHLFRYLDAHHALLKFLSTSSHFNFTTAIITNSRGITEQRLRELAPASTIDPRRATDLVLHCLGYGAQALITDWIRHDFQEPASEMAYLYYQLIVAPFFTLNNQTIHKKILQDGNGTLN